MNDTRTVIEKLQSSIDDLEWYLAKFGELFPEPFEIGGESGNVTELRGESDAYLTQGILVSLKEALRIMEERR